MSDHDYGTRPETLDALHEFIEAKVAGPHDYNSSAEALHDITAAAFNYAASALGNSGFQASYAALKLLGTVNGYNGPYGVLKAEDMMYPQYEAPEAQATKWATEWREWLAQQARERLAAEKDNALVSPTVRAHWQRLADAA